MTSLLALAAAAAAPEIAPAPDEVPHIEAGALDTSAPPAPAPTQPALDPAAADSAAKAEAVDDAMLLRDPWHKVNRDIFTFDMFFDRKLLGPVAHGYAAVVPNVARQHISNLILNLDEPITTMNGVLQLKFGRALKSGARFVINSTIGIAGLFDVAAKNGLPRRVADFGQTLARYGAKPGPYVMVPFLGPSNIRDGIGRIADNLADPLGFVIGGVFTSAAGAGRFAAEGIDWRQQNDGTMKTIREATDPYAFVRSAYSQQRAAAVQDATGKARALPDF